LFYIDGSKIDNSFYLGATVYSPQLELYLMHKLPENILVFLLGQSNEILTALDLNLKSIFIITDFKSVLDALCSF